MIFLEQTIAILWKDIRSELRSKQMWLGMGLFALLVLVIFNFTFDLRIDNKAAVAPGALWVSFVCRVSDFVFRRPINFPPPAEK